MVEKIDYLYINGDTSLTYIFLHGWGMDKNAFSKVVQKMNDNHAKILIDFLGFGKSGMPNEYYDTYEYAYQVFLLLKKLNVDNLVIVGHSFGGRVAIILSSIFHIKIYTLILSASAGLNRFSFAKTIKVFIYKIKKYLVSKKLISYKYLCNSGSVDYRKLDNTMKQIFIRVVNQDLSSLCNFIECKTLLVWDKKDKVTGYWIARKLNKIIGNSKIILFKSGGHFCCYSNMYKFINILENV